MNFHSINKKANLTFNFKRCHKMDEFFYALVVDAFARKSTNVI